MREIIEISIDDVRPDRDDVLKAQGIPPGRASSENITTLLRRTTELFLESCEPAGIISEISIPEFEIIYPGEGLNEKETPLDRVFRRADTLALFAVTSGQKVTEKIDELFAAREFALGAMLDSFASVGTDKAADFAERYFFRWLIDRGKIASAKAASIYSPGYCGWHVSGQKKLFESLQPEDIGITLLDSFLMKPLKSISGVIVVGEKEIHIFEDSYSFCSECKTRFCRERITTFSKESRANNKKGAL